MTTDRSKIEAALTATGGARVEPVEPRLDALEARLMDAIAADDTQRGAVVLPLESARSRRASAARKVVFGAAAACLLAVVVLAAGWYSTGDDSYVIAAADQVEVILPDGSAIRGVAGVELPLGARIDVAGSMMVDDVVYGPGNYEVTDNGVTLATDGGSSSTVTVVADGSSGNGGVAPPTATSTTVAAPSTTVVRPPTTVNDRPVDGDDRRDGDGGITPVPPSTRAPGDGQRDHEQVRPTTTERRHRPTTTSAPPTTRPPHTTTTHRPRHPPTTSATSTTTTTTTVVDRPPGDGRDGDSPEN